MDKMKDEIEDEIIDNYNKLKELELQIDYWTEFLLHNTDLF